MVEPEIHGGQDDQIQDLAHTILDAVYDAPFEVGVVSVARLTEGLFSISIAGHGNPESATYAMHEDEDEPRPVD